MKNTIASLAPSITKNASRQTYYTIRLLVDRDRLNDAYRAYAYFRWIDDYLDSPAGSPSDHLLFLQRQKSLLDCCYRRDYSLPVNIYEQMLVDLVRRDSEQDSGLQFYLRNMMAVMEFDAHRRGQLVTQKELDAYTHFLASAVTESMHYFVGHCCPSPHDETRYLAVTAAHITHMLRDTVDDVQNGYYNIPSELLAAKHFQPGELHSNAYRLWVRSRVEMARACFSLGKGYLRRVKNLRCRLAGLAYTARFEWLLDTFESEDYYLRPSYHERKSFHAALGMSGMVFSSLFNLRVPRSSPAVLGTQSAASQSVASHSAASRPVASRQP
jgi:phytoene/squalene synthetase